MGSSKTTDQQQQTTNTLDPWVKSLLQTNYNQAEAVANQPYQTYDSQRIAGFNPTQTAAQGMVAGIANNQTGNDTLNSAISAAKDAAGYQPLTVTPQDASSQGYNATGYNASMLDPNDIAKFENPYTQQVVDTTAADANHALQVQENQNNSNMTKLGAWRGSAGAVQNGVAQGDSNRALDSTIAGLRSQGFNTAAGLAGGNVDRANAAAQFLAGAQNQAGEFGANAANAAALENARSALSAAQGNQQAGLTMNQQRQAASSLLAQQSGDQLQQAATRAGLLGAVGDTQQANTQQQLDFNYQEFLRRIGYGAQQQQIRNSAIGLIPAITNSSSSGTSTQTTSGGLGGIFGALGSLAQIAPMFSDERTKTNVTTAGYDGKGRRWVDYHYKWDDPEGPRRHGLLAQETIRTDPQAILVDRNSGLLGIDYGKLAA